MAEFTFQLNKKRISIYLIIIAAIYAVLFVIIGIVGDYNATLAINQWAGTFPQWYISLAKFYTDFGYYIFGIIGIVIACLVFFNKKFERFKPYRNMFLGLFYGFFVSDIITGGILKPLIGRTRPYIQYPNQFNTHGENSTGYSFPSGHATAAFGMSGAMMARVKNWVVRILLYAYAISLSLTRPFFGVHYVTDVIAGSLVGLTCSLGFYVLFEYLESKGKLSDKVQKIFFIIALIIVIIDIILNTI
ncbi:MAG TPA: phosphatase PAP2 family protein [Candidatus Lokiarchaeia archaeon]|nr:phosphatase PAP2 family protein [Candidatus Lokiarchaeia archaeon]